MLASAASDGTLRVALAALADALTREAEAVYLAHPHLPPLPLVVRYAPRIDAAGIMDAMNRGVADCLTLASAEAGRARALGHHDASVVLSSSGRAVHARTRVGGNIFDPSAIAQRNT